MIEIKRQSDKEMEAVEQGLTDFGKNHVAHHRNQTIFGA
jgi:hypothetical protein